MSHTLIWNLGNANPDVEHGEYVYDLLYLSMQFAKDLGYRTAFYGTHKSPQIVSKWVDECYDVTNIVPYKLYDDIKVWIWYNRHDSYTTIDSDVFLYNRIVERLPEEIPFHINKIREINSNDIFDNSFFNLRNNNVPFTLRCEEFNASPVLGNNKIIGDIHPTIKSLKALNEFDIKNIIKEWDFNNTRSLNTGIINWGVHGDFKKYYCETYVKFREWVLQNEQVLQEKDSQLHYKCSVLSHFVCEHLLYQLARYYNIKFEDLKSNVNNNYIHMKGGEKFKNKKFIYSVKLLSDFHKKRGGGLLKESYQKLLLENKIYDVFYAKK